ncbi:MAG: transglutaminase domain-containing protein [Aeromicrobium sp.]|uniref:transglutaminase domain-containing protein n=1 Tax=Aeromicrobium sp. TaxID=1871063 RepID=UPI0039E4635E
MTAPASKRIFVSDRHFVTTPVAVRPAKISRRDWDGLAVINDHIIDHVSYDHARAAITKNREQLTPQMTLDRGRGVCSDYAALFEKIARQEGFTARSVTSDRLNHAWNEVKLAGRWWIVDVTWNDGEIFHDGRPIPPVVTSDPDYRKRYFLTTVERERLLRRHDLLDETHDVRDQKPVDYERSRQAIRIMDRRNEEVRRRNEVAARQRALVDQHQALVREYNSIVRRHNAATGRATREAHSASLDRLKVKEAELSALIDRANERVEEHDRLIAELLGRYERLAARHSLVVSYS